MEETIQAGAKGGDKLDRAGCNAKNRTKRCRTEFASHNDGRESRYVTYCKAEQYARSDKHDWFVASPSYSSLSSRDL
jgi:hypothetical protein